jgi:hypothetical protein
MSTSTPNSMRSLKRRKYGRTDINEAHRVLLPKLGPVAISCRILRTASPHPLGLLSPRSKFAVQNGMSALPPKADMCSAKRDVRFVPLADIRQKKEAARGQAASKRTSRLGTEGDLSGKSLRHIGCVQQSQSASFLVQTPQNESALMISKVGLQKPFVSLDVCPVSKKKRLLNLRLRFLP